MSVSQAEFEQMQEQLLQVKAQLYEWKDKEARATKARDAALAEKDKLSAAFESLQKSKDASNPANREMQTISEDGTVVESSSNPPPSSSSSASSSLSNLLSSVKRNSVSIKDAISNAAHGNKDTGSASGHTGGSGPSDKYEAELSSLRAQHAADLEELREQNVALKMNVQHLHKKSLDMEKQNATLMSHLSNLEEERHSLAEKRERELRRRQAKLEKGAAKAEEEDDGLDEDDITVAREKWTEFKSKLEAKLASATSQLTALQAENNTLKEEVSKKDKNIESLQIKVSDEMKNFERILTKMQEKDEELNKVREEVHQKNTVIAQLRAGNPNASASPAPAAAANASLTSPKSPGRFANFLNKITDKDGSKSNANAAANNEAAAQPTAAPSADETTSSTSSSSSNAAADSTAASTAASTEPSSSSTTTSSSTAASPSSPTSPSAAEDIPPWSASQPLEQQVLSLQHELGQLRILNEHVVQSIQKKDATIRTIQDDAERIMSKLAEKEMHIMSLRESASEVVEMQKELKKKEAQVAKLTEQVKSGGGGGGSGSGGMTSAQELNAQMELKAATDSLNVVNQEFDALKETLENTKDMLFLAETQLIDKQKLLGEQSESIKELRASTEQHEKTIETLMHTKESKEKELHEHIDYLERKCLAEVKEWEIKYDEEHAENQKKQAGLEQRLSILQAELNEVLQRETELQNAHTTLQTNFASLQASEKQFQTQSEGLSKSLQELSMNAGIETKKRNQLVLELKNALKNELIKSKEYAARLKNAEDDIVTLRVMNQHQISASGGVVVADANGMPGADGSMNPSSAAQSLAAYNGSGGSVPPSPGSTMHASPSGVGGASGGANKGVEQEVTVALAQKLAELQNDKFVLQKQKRSLEEHIDLLQNDVNQKKEMIRNLVRKVETGALSSNSASQVDAGKMQLFSSLTMEAKQELFDKMEIILQETTLQNAQYKNNLQSMGVEISKLMAELEEKTSEVAVVKEELEIAKDEVELLQQSANDSTALLRNTEATSKKLEKVLNAVLKQLEKEGVLDECIKNLEEDCQTLLKQVLSVSTAATPSGSKTPGRPLASPSNAASKSVAATPSAAESKSTAETAAALSAASAVASSSNAKMDALRAKEENDRAELARLEQKRKQEELDHQRARDLAKKQAEEAQKQDDERIAALTAQVAAVQSADRARVEEERALQRRLEEERREALMAEADSISAALSPRALQQLENQRSASQLLADLDTSVDGGASSTKSQRNDEAEEGEEDDADSFKQDTDRSYLNDE